MVRRPGTPEDSQVIIRTLACVLDKLVEVNQKVRFTTQCHASSCVTRHHVYGGFTHVLMLLVVCAWLAA